LEIKLLDFKMPVLLEHMDQTSVIKVSWYCSEGTYIINSNPTHGVVYSIQHYVIKFVSDLR
jgi:hypothetical protein